MLILPMLYERFRPPKHENRTFRGRHLMVRALRSKRPSSSDANRQTAKPPASPSPLSISKQSKSLLRSLQQECSTMLINEDTDR